MVYLVGAGPGDVGLVTLRAKDCLARADVVVYDRLANDSILQFAKKGAKFIYVGKAAGNHAMPQEEINELLARLAKEYECVVRLKGGDPFVFGRGGEEALRLADENLPFEIVPGVTSAIAVPAYAGIPVTHRGKAASFAVITGHEDPQKNESSICWEKLAGGVDTLAFLMGVKNLPLIAEKLMANGKDPDTPAALIRNGTRANQQTIVTTLKDAPNADIKPPAIFIVGQNVTLRENLRWFDNFATRPLAGRKILVTRSREQASELTRQLTDLGAQCEEYPAIKLVAPSDNFRGVDAAIERLNEFSQIIFTSANGVERFFARLKAANKDSRALFGAKIAVIGSATAARLERFGIVADIVPKDFRAEGLVEALTGKITVGEKILLPRAEEARDVLPRSLADMGGSVTVVPVYKTVCADITDVDLPQRLSDGEFSAVTFTSSSTVKNFVQILGTVAPLKSTPAFCIGPITAATLKEYGAEPAGVAEEYTIAGLVCALKTFFA